MGRTAPVAVNGSTERREWRSTPNGLRHTPLRTALKLRTEQQTRQRENATRWHSSGYVFTTATGNPVDPRSFNRLFDARCAKAGVRRIEVHTTRKTCATLLAALDVHPRVAMRVLRHSQITLTMDLYTEVHDGTTVAALKKLGHFIGGTGDEETPGQ